MPYGTGTEKGADKSAADLALAPTPRGSGGPVGRARARAARRDRRIRGGIDAGASCPGRPAHTSSRPRSVSSNRRWLSPSPSSMSRPALRPRLARHAEAAFRGVVLLDVRVAAASDQAEIAHVIGGPTGSGVVLRRVVVRFARQAGVAQRVHRERRQSPSEGRAATLNHRQAEAGALPAPLRSAQQAHPAVLRRQHLALEPHQPVAPLRHADQRHAVHPRPLRQPARFVEAVL